MRTLSYFFSSFFFAVLFLAYSPILVLAAQQASPSSLTPDHTEANAYRSLFRRTLFYKKLDDEAEVAHQPGRRLERIQAQKFSLTDSDSTTLLRLAQAYETEINPIHKQMMAVIAKFHSKFPDNVIPASADLTPSPELPNLQQKQESITLRYRDLLHSSMRDADFQRTDSKVIVSLGRPLSTNNH